jgi:hypothetical protein
VLLNLGSLVSFVQLGLNEADTLKSSSLLLYSISVKSIYTQKGWREAMLIERWSKKVLISLWEISVASLQVLIKNINQ